MAQLAPFLRTDFKAVDKREPLSSVMGWLQGEGKRVPIIMDGDQPYGIPNDRALVSRSLNQKAHVSTYTLATRALPQDASLDEAARRMAELRAPYLPVADVRGRCVGYVTALDVARAAGRSSHAGEMAVPVKHLKERDTLGDAVHLFAKEYVPFLPVMDGNGRVRGVLPRSTVIRMETENGQKGRKDAGGEKLHPLNDPVEGLMDDAVVLPAAASFADVLATIDENGYAIVQERNGSVLGVVTPETLLRR